MTDTAARSRQPKGLTTGGQFAAEHRAEAQGLALSARPTRPQYVWSVPGPGEPLTERMTGYEVGLRTDLDQDITTFRLAVDYGTAASDREDRFDAAYEYLPEGYFPNKVTTAPVSVVDGQVVLEMSIRVADPAGAANAEHDAEFARGQADRAQWLRRPASPHEKVDASLFLEDSDIGYLYQVPQMPEGTPEDVEVDTWQKDTDRHLAELTHAGKRVALIDFTPAPDEYADSHWDFRTGESWRGGDAEAPEWVEENREEYEQILLAVARNHAALTDVAASRVRWTHGFADRSRQMALAGNPEGDEA